MRIARGRKKSSRGCISHAFRDPSCDYRETLRRFLDDFLRLVRHVHSHAFSSRAMTK
jgi:hypothetical protein